MSWMVHTVLEPGRMLRLYISPHYKAPWERQVREGKDLSSGTGCEGFMNRDDLRLLNFDVLFCFFVCVCGEGFGGRMLCVLVHVCTSVRRKEDRTVSQQSLHLHLI